ncbi:hypothetical protein EC968_001872 [Mortierella alpina]|nr:hypothetical protein EC968_001872 [Mortierella alpina]
MKIAWICTLAAMATAVVALPTHSRHSLAETEHALERRGTPGGSISVLQDTPNPLTRRGDDDDARTTLAEAVCKILKREEFKNLIIGADTLLKEIQKDDKAKEQFQSLDKVLIVFEKTFSSTFKDAGNKIIQAVKDELNKGGDGLGNTVEEFIKKTGEDLEATLLTIGLKAMECMPKLTEEASTKA